MDFNDIPIEIKGESIKLKSKYKNIYCIKTSIGCVIVRLLSRGEFTIVAEMREYLSTAMEDFVFKNCVLYPKFSNEELNNMMAGTFANIVNIVIELSGFTSSDALMGWLDTSREAMDLADARIIATLCKAFPQLTPEDIDGFDIQKITYYLALAEQMLGITLEFSQNLPHPSASPADIDFVQENKTLGNAGGADFKHGRPV